jgi:hypothetical protein
MLECAFVQISGRLALSSAGFNSLVWSVPLNSISKFVLMSVLAPRLGIRCGIYIPRRATATRRSLRACGFLRVTQFMLAFVDFSCAQVYLAFPNDTSFWRHAS